MAGLPASLPEIIRAGVSSATDEIHTAMPGKVTLYDPLTNTAFVKPALKHALYRPDGGRVFEDYPELPFVPVIFPSAGGMTVRLPVTAGDTVLLVFAESSMAEWRSSGQASAQEDARRHSLGWPVAIPGLFPDTKIPPVLDAAEAAAGGMVIGDENSVAKMLFGGTIPGIRFGQLAVSPVALSVPTDAGISSCIAAINALIATVNALISTYNGHTHLYSPGPSPAAPTATPSATASAAAAGPGAAATTASALVKSL